MAVSMAVEPVNLFRCIQHSSQPDQLIFDEGVHRVDDKGTHARTSSVLTGAVRQMLLAVLPPRSLDCRSRLPTRRLNNELRNHWQQERLCLPRSSAARNDRAVSSPNRAPSIQLVLIERACAEQRSGEFADLPGLGRVETQLGQRRCLRDCQTA